MRKLALIILDGWGIGEDKPNNAIYVANTPFFDHLWKTYPKTQLQASGEFVGLPHGQIGGSEVGHLTIGAGRVIFQELPRISRHLEHENIMSVENFAELINAAKKNHLHLIGLLSPGGVHSHEQHLFKLLEMLKKYSCKSPIIHFISDGRDLSPTLGVKSAQRLIKKLHELQFGTVATLTGRFFAMDRDKNYDRTKKAVDLIVHAKAEQPASSKPNTFDNLIEQFQESHKNNITDEFIEPVVIDKQYKGIKKGEPLFFFNFRRDRMKQLVSEIHKQIPEHEIFTMTEYDPSYTFSVIFGKQVIKNTVSELLSSYQLTQLKATETEKFPHVTYFFNGGRETVFKGELHNLSESNKVKHDTMPEMKAQNIVHNVLKQVKEYQPNFILVNFANSDMVGHTGNFQAVVKAIETVDHELKKLCDELTKHHYICVITADHGNADIMYDPETKEPHTAHTLNPVPFIIYDPSNKHNLHVKLNQNPENGLSKIAGTILQLMELKTNQHEFKSLIENKH